MEHQQSHSEMSYLLPFLRLVLKNKIYQIYNPQCRAIKPDMILSENMKKNLPLQWSDNFEDRRFHNQVDSPPGPMTIAMTSVGR